MEDKEVCDRAQTTAEEELLGGAVHRSWPATVRDELIESGG